MNSFAFRRFWWTPWLWLFLALGGCSQSSVSQDERIVNQLTVAASKPSVRPASGLQQVQSPSATVLPNSPTSGPVVSTPISPASTSSATAPTPLPPTATPNPAFKDFSFCTQTAGGDGQERFSGHLYTTQAVGFPAYERLTLDFERKPDAPLLQALADCVNERDFRLLSREPGAPGKYVLQVKLPTWLHDEDFYNSPVRVVQTFTTTKVIQSLKISFDPHANHGATLVLGLSHPALYHLELESVSPGTVRLVIDVARATTILPASNPLAVPLGSNKVQAPPLFFLREGDIWRLDASGAISLTQTLADETALAVSNDGQMLAFCRTQNPGVDPTEHTGALPSTLWVMKADGKEERQVATAGISCAEPSFSPDDSMLAFGVVESELLPLQQTIWMVSLGRRLEAHATPPKKATAAPKNATATSALSNTAALSSTVALSTTKPSASSGSVQQPPVDKSAVRFLAGRDAWNRSQPQWLANGSLLYAAEAQDGRKTLLLRAPDTGLEIDVGANLVTSEEYEALTRPSVSPDGKMVAVEALRGANKGADLLLLELDKTGFKEDYKKNTLKKGYWTRPLAWQKDGSLIYLTTACTSTLVDDYALYRRSKDGKEPRLLATGANLGALGEVVATEQGLAYVLATRAQPGTRGPTLVAPHSPASLWFWDLAKNSRGKIQGAEQGIPALVKGAGETTLTFLPADLPTPEPAPATAITATQALTATPPLSPTRALTTTRALTSTTTRPLTTTRILTTTRSLTRTMPLGTPTSTPMLQQPSASSGSVQQSPAPRPSASSGSVQQSPAPEGRKPEILLIAPLPEVVKELGSYEKNGQTWRNLLVKPGIDAQSLLALAQKLHKQSPATRFRIFDDDAQFAEYLDWDKNYPNNNALYPETWAAEHLVAMINIVTPIGKPGKWQLVKSSGEVFDLE